jgi:hypothetical protein
LIVSTPYKTYSDIPSNAPNSTVNEVDFNILEAEFATTDFIHRAYFTYANDLGLNKTQGIVATPKFIADFMVKECIRKQRKPLNEIHWLDPCSGSGIFLESILNEYGSIKKSLSVSDLPHLTVQEISNYGIQCAYKVIAKTLQNFGLKIDDYFQSKKLILDCTDSLLKNPERRSIFDIDKKAYDVVIGNPPYVRASRISRDYRKLLSSLFPETYSGNGDLYYYFISSAINSLRDDGILCFISQANFFRASSATSLRQYLAKTAIVETVLDLDELKVFSNADLHSAIFVLKKKCDKSKSIPIKHVHIRSIDQLKNIQNTEIEYDTISVDNITDTGWQFNLIENEIKDISKVANCNPLSKSGFHIVSGVRPGVKEAFVYEFEEIANLDAELISNWFVPYIKASDIDKWSTKRTDKYLLFIPHESQLPPKEILNLLANYKARLEKRPEVKNQDGWYRLRQCSYYNVFKRPRIIFPDICRRLRFSYQTDASFILDGAFAIETDNLALLGILNSDLAYTYFVKHCSSLGNALNKGRIRLKKGQVERFPLPTKLFSNIEWQRKIIEVVNHILNEGESPALMAELNQKVEELYS